MAAAIAGTRAARRGDRGGVRAQRRHPAARRGVPGHAESDAASRRAGHAGRRGAGPGRAARPRRRGRWPGRRRCSAARSTSTCSPRSPATRPDGGRRRAARADRAVLRAAAPATGSAYDFRHALIRDALYADLPPHRRRELHARAAEAAVAAGFARRVRQRPVRARPPAGGGATGTRWPRRPRPRRMSAHREAVELYRRAQRTAPADTARRRPRRPARRAGRRAGGGRRQRGRGRGATRRPTALRLELGDDARPRPRWCRDWSRSGTCSARPGRAGRPCCGEALAADRGPHRTPRPRRCGPSIHAALAAAYMLDRRLDRGDRGRRAGPVDRGRGPRPGDALQPGRDARLGAGLRRPDGRGLAAARGRDRAGARLARSRGRGGPRLPDDRHRRASVLVEYDRGACAGCAEGSRTPSGSSSSTTGTTWPRTSAHVRWATGDWAAAEAGGRQALADGRGGITTRITALHVLGYLALGRGEPAGRGRRMLTEARGLGERMRELQRVSPAWWGLAEAALRAATHAARRRLVRAGLRGVGAGRGTRPICSRSW